MARKKFETLLFDWDGSITHSLPAWMKCFHLVFEEYGRPITEQELMASKLFIHWKPVTELGIPSLEDFTQRMLKHIPLHVPLADLHPTVLETLEQLRKTPRKHGIVTSSRRPQIEAALELHQIGHHFDEMVTFEEVTKPKPDAEPVLKALAKLGGVPETSLIIGDSPADIGAGKAAGVTTVLYYPKSHERFYEYEMMKELKADYLIREFKELLGVVGK